MIITPAVSNAKGFLEIISENLAKPILPQKGVDIKMEYVLDITLL